MVSAEGGGGTPLELTKGQRINCNISSNSLKARGEIEITHNVSITGKQVPL